MSVYSIRKASPRSHTIRQRLSTARGGKESDHTPQAFQQPQEAHRLPSRRFQCSTNGKCPLHLPPDTRKASHTVQLRYLTPMEFRNGLSFAVLSVNQAERLGRPGRPASALSLGIRNRGATDRLMRWVGDSLHGVGNTGSGMEYRKIDRPTLSRGW